MQTFVVRLWEPAGAPHAGAEMLHGVVEHLGSGLSETFTDDAELLTFLRERPWERELAARREERGGAP